MYHCRRAASPSWSISHPSPVPGRGRQVQVIRLPPPPPARVPAPRWPRPCFGPSGAALPNRKVPGLPRPGWRREEAAGPGDGWAQPGHRRGDGPPPVVASSVVGWGGTGMGALPVAPGDALSPAGLGDVEDESRFLPLHWDLLVLGLVSGLGFRRCAWWVKPFHPSHLRRSRPGQVSLVL